MTPQIILRILVCCLFRTLLATQWIDSILEYSIFTVVFIEFVACAKNLSMFGNSSFYKLACLAADIVEDSVAELIFQLSGSDSCNRSIIANENTTLDNSKYWPELSDHNHSGCILLILVWM